MKPILFTIFLLAVVAKLFAQPFSERELYQAEELVNTFCQSLVSYYNGVAKERGIEDLFGSTANEVLTYMKSNGTHVQDMPHSGSTFRNFTETVAGVPIAMVALQGGTFSMGSNDGEDREKPVHSVTVSDFYMGKTEVTFAQYDAFCAAKGKSKPGDLGWGRGNLPVINVSWNDAIAYCHWLSQQTGKTYRLPTESELVCIHAGSKSWQFIEYLYDRLFNK